MERENRFIADCYITLEDKTELMRYLQEQQCLGKQPVTGVTARKYHEECEIKPLADELYDKVHEINHPPEFAPIIDSFNQHIQNEFNRLNINGDPKIIPQQIHIIYPYHSVLVGSKKNTLAFGSCDTITDAIYLKNINRRKFELSVIDKKLTMAFTLIHEAFHVNSFHQFRLVQGDFELGRIGYNKYLFSDPNIDRFSLLNEYMTDRLAIAFFEKNGKCFADKFGLPFIYLIRKIRWINSEFLDWSSHNDIFDLVMKKISFQIGQTLKSVKKRFKDAYFTGDMTHLKWIEQTFGRQSLRLLATMQEDDQAGQKELLDYLKTKNPDLKERLLKKYIT